jgi:hypothetical protein
LVPAWHRKALFTEFYSIILDGLTLLLLSTKQLVTSIQSIPRKDLSSFTLATIDSPHTLSIKLSYAVSPCPPIWAQVLIIEF